MFKSFALLVPPNGDGSCGAWNIFQAQEAKNAVLLLEHGGDSSDYGHSLVYF